jgi:DNA invertase Pin-like site-specific DNA recombinase
MARKRNLVSAVGYMRTSSATNVGADKDSEKRQRVAIERFAKASGFALVDWFYDPAVSGADPIESRPGFSALLDRIEDNGVKTVIVEDASRFARDLITQELGILALIKRGMTVITTSGDVLTDSSDPSRTMMRQIAGSFAQYEKARLVAKLKAARDRKKAATGKCGGRKSYAEAKPETVALAKELHGRRMSLRKISAALASQGHLTARGKPYVASAVQAMVG